MSRDISMKVTNLHDFLHRYFSAQQCEIISDQDGILKVQLNEQLDQALMNRPFYWHYMKSSGNLGEPAQLTFITNPNKREHDGELIHFGSPRLQQIFNHLKNTGNQIKLFQKVDTQKNTALYPWLLINLKISYKGKHKKEELFSIGLNLMNGIMKTKMMEMLQEMQLNLTISDFCYPMSPLIKVNSGFLRITSVIDDYLKNQSHDWAEESMIKMREEIKMVQHFYENNSNEVELTKEINDLKKLYTPSISHQVINGGIIYLTEDSI